MRHEPAAATIAPIFQRPILRVSAPSSARRCEAIASPHVSVAIGCAERMNAALPFTRPPHSLLFEAIIRRALEEDLGRAGDITSELTVPADVRSSTLVAQRAHSPTSS